MAFSWKTAGYTYLQYLDVCSKTLRECLKPDLAAAAMKRSESTLKFSNWSNGKQGDLKLVSSILKLGKTDLKEPSK